jgi:DNA repair protein RAD16
LAFRGEATRLIVSLQTAVPPPKNKGKDKGSTSLVPSIADGEDLSEEAIVSELELEYDENASIDESDASGSEFQVSEDDFENAEEEEEFIVKSRKTPRKQSILITDEDFFNNDSDEEIMLDAAIHESLQTARLDNASRNGVSSSSRASVSSNPAAVLRAAAAERRLARANQVIDVDDFQVIDVDELSTLTESDAQSSSDEEALSKVKGKGKSKAPKKSATVYDTTSTKFMSITQRRKLNREQRKLAAASRRENRKEELAMIKQLGRPLTHVRLKISANNVSSGLIYTGRKIDNRASQTTRRT